MSTPQKATKWLIYTASNPTVTRIIPDLAVEIGLNESIILLQISFWLMTSNNEQEGKYWTFQSLRDMREKAFPYWSHETIRRTIKNLKDAGYILIGSFNKRKGDNTQWFALEPDKCSQLKSVLCHEAVEEKAVTKRDRLSQNEQPLPQNVTTLPEITTETTTKESTRKRSPLKIQFPSNIKSYTENHIEAYFEQNTADLVALIHAWHGEMYDSFANISSVDSKAYIEVHHEMVRLNKPNTDYVALAKCTRDKEAWKLKDKGTIRVLDMLKHVTEYKPAPAKIYTDPAMDLNVPQPITPILIRELQETS